VHMKRAILGVSVLAVSAAVGVACSSSSSNPGSPGDDSGTDASGSSSGTTSSGSSSGTTSSGSSSGTSSGSSSGGTHDGGTDAGDAGDAGAASLYTTLGGHAGIRSAVHAVVVKELADPIIASYFFNQTSPPAAGHPSATQIEECFTDLLASAATVGGPEKYVPNTTTVGPFDDAGVNVGDGGPSDAGGAWTCRDMSSIHQPLKISSATFDLFVNNAASALASPPFNLTGANLNTLATLLVTPKAQIVDPNLPDGGDAGVYRADAQ
jgi:hypothetical protein